MAGAAGILGWLSTCFVFVDETEVVILEKLGKVTAVLDRDSDRGLNLRAPWPIGNVRRFDRRIQLFDPPGREVFTRDRKNIIADAYLCWRIAEPRDGEAPENRPVLRFLRALGNRETAQSRLGTRLRSTLAGHVAQVELTSLMFVTDRESAPLDAAVTHEPADVSGTGRMVDPSTRKSLDEISRELLASMRQRSDETSSIRDQMGIEVVDLRIKRLSFPRGNQQAVFERMKSERMKIADRYRSAGLAENTRIRSQADTQYSEILATADAEAERIRGKAEAEALAILNAAHKKDPEFYRLVKTLDSYEQILNENTTLVLSASSSLLKLLVDGIPENLPARPPGLQDETQDVKPVTESADDRNTTGDSIQPAAGESGQPEPAKGSAATGLYPDRAPQLAAARLSRISQRTPGGHVE